ncbi:MAG TPA: MFS transporter [Nevskiales bacterium]|nr:MFS transporter [Nevskiales bacterium]
MSAPLPYARLSGFYFFYYAAIGAFLPYWGLYLQWRGYTPLDIGIASGAYSGVRIIAPLAWGWLADHWQVRLPMIRIAALLAPLTFAVPLEGGQLAWLVVQMLLLSFCLNAVLPQLEVLTLNHLYRREGDYGVIRLWGSVGFVLAVLVLGPVLDQTGLKPVPWLIAGLLLAMGLLSLSVPDARAQEEPTGSAEGLLRVIRRPEVIALLVACFLSQLSFAPYYSFFSLYLEQHGYSKTSIGLLWSLGVIAEVGVFVYMARLLGRFGARSLMLWALGLTALRWALQVIFVDQLAMLLLIQCLHLASFGVYHAVSVHLIHQMFRGRLQGRGQAFYSAVSFGAGGALGALLSGHLWETLSPDSVYWMAAVSAALGWWVAWRWLKLETPARNAA